MTLPVFLVPAERLDGPSVLLDGPEGRHAALVRRMRPGEPVQLVDGAGLRVTGTVAEVRREELVVTVTARRQEAGPSPRLVLVQALAKGDRGELAVELATEVGVDEVVPWAASRSVVRWDGDRGRRALERWRSTAAEASKQSRRARWPVVADLHDTAGIAARVTQATRGVVLSEDAELPLADLSMPPGGEIVLVVGPEGGLSEGELGLLTSAGASARRLGPTVLRTSSAGAVAVAVLSAAGRWR